LSFLGKRRPVLLAVVPLEMQLIPMHCILRSVYFVAKK
jgi:hypothetical protein